MVSRMKRSYWNSDAESSIDEASQKPQKFIVNVEATLNDLLQREDTDRNHQITIDDDGPKVSVLRGVVGFVRLIRQS